MKFLLRGIAASVLFFCAVNAALAQGGWIRKSGEVFTKLGVSTLSTDKIYNEFGTGSAMSRYSLTTITGYGEWGIGSDVMIVTDLQLLRINQFDGFGASAGPGDMTLGVRYGVAGGDWPISIGVAADLPTGDPSAQAAPVGITAPAMMPVPRGDGELNVWLSGGISHSFWPVEAYVSADVAYSVRGIATREFVRQFNNGHFTNQYRVSVKAGYKVLPEMWASLAIFQLGNAGAIQPTSFSALGFGEGVSFTAWDLGVSYDVGDITLTLNGSTAFFAPKNIFGGMQILLGVATTFGGE